MLEIKIPLFHSRPKKYVQYRRFAQINDVKKLNANVAQKIAYRESKKSNPKIWGPNLIHNYLPLVLLFFICRAMCTYSQIPNEAGSGGKLLELFEFSFAIIML